METSQHNDCLPHELHVHTNCAVDQLQIRLNLYLQNTLHTLLRPRDEAIDKTLARIASTYKKKKQGHHKKPSTASSTPPHLIYILHYQQRLDASKLTNGQWETGMEVVLDRQVFHVVVNPPLIISLTTFPRKHMVVGCPIVPMVVHESADSYELHWYRDRKSLIEEYDYFTTGMTYVPTEDDLGRRLKIFAVPLRHQDASILRGRSVVFYLNSPIQHSSSCSLMKTLREGFCSLRSPQALTQSDELRVVTYNILSESYASTDYAKKRLYGYVQHPAYLESEFRSALTLDELLAYQADIVCLQECDRKVFESYFQPYLQKMRYSCHFGSKFGGVQEGCAMFLRTSSLCPLMVIHLPLREFILSDPLISPILDARDEVREVLGSHINTIVQVAICQCVSDADQFVIIANTHLFYHPAAAYVRLVHTYVILHLLERLQQDIITERRVDVTSLLNTNAENSYDPLNLPCDRPRVAIIFAGDLNSTPETAVIELINR